MVLICIIFKNQQKVLKIYFHRRVLAFEYAEIFGKFQLPTACRSWDIEFLRYIAKFRKKRTRMSRRREKVMKVWHFPRGIFRWIRNGKLQIWVHSTRRDLSFILMLTTINFIQYSRHKSHLKIRFLHRAPVSYYYSLIYYWQNAWEWFRYV